MLKRFTLVLTLAAAAFVAALMPALAQGLPGPLAAPAWLAANLDHPDLVVIDIRGKTAEDDFAAGHVPGAVWSAYPGNWREPGEVPGRVPEAVALQEAISGLGVNDTSLVVIVSAGTGATEFGGAARVYWSLKYAGHDTVAILDGGWAAWAADAANPVATGATLPPARGNFVAQLRPDLLATTEEVVTAQAAGVTLLDARGPDQYSGAKAGTGARPGHIPGALSLESSVFYDTAANRLKTLDELRALVPAALADPNAEAIAYCSAGHLSATQWFVLHELLGHQNLSLYADSIIGWALDPARPVVTN